MTTLLDGQPVTYSDCVACIRRELAFRRRLYPRWVEQEKLTAEEADREIAIMAKIEADYLKCVELEKRGPGRGPVAA